MDDWCKKTRRRPVCVCRDPHHNESFLERTIFKGSKTPSERLLSDFVPPFLSSITLAAGVVPFKLVYSPKTLQNWQEIQFPTISKDSLTLISWLQGKRMFQKGTLIVNNPFNNYFQWVYRVEHGLSIRIQSERKFSSSRDWRETFDHSYCWPRWGTSMSNKHGSFGIWGPFLKEQELLGLLGIPVLSQTPQAHNWTYILNKKQKNPTRVYTDGGVECLPFLR